MSIISPRNLQPRFYSSSAGRPLAPFDVAPPPQLLRCAEALVSRPARGTGPNARPRVRTRFPPTYLGPNLLAYIASLGERRRLRRGPQEAPGRRRSSPRGPRRFRCSFPFPSCYLVRPDQLRSVLSSPLSGYYPCSRSGRTHRCRGSVGRAQAAAADASDPSPVSWSHPRVRKRYLQDHRTTPQWQVASSSRAAG